MKSRTYNLKLITVIFIVTSCQLLVISAPKARAISPTPEVTPTEVRRVEDNLEKIKEIREAVKEKVRERLQEAKKGQKRAYVGEITDISNSTLVINTVLGEKQAKIASDAAILSKGKQKIEFEDLKIGNFCIAMGYLTDNEVLDARRILVLPKPKPPVREVAVGRVIDISPEEKILTVKNERKGITYTIEVTEKTIITKKTDTKVGKVKFSVIEIDDRIVAIGTPSENEKKLISAKLIHIIPGLPKAVSPTPGE